MNRGPVLCVVEAQHGVETGREGAHAPMAMQATTQRQAGGQHAETEPGGTNGHAGITTTAGRWAERGSHKESERERASLRSRVEGSKEQHCVRRSGRW